MKENLTNELQEAFYTVFPSLIKGKYLYVHVTSLQVMNLSMVHGSVFAPCLAFTAVQYTMSHGKY